MKMSEADIITKLMSDRRMGNMVLDFNLYFLGYRLDSLWYGNGAYNNIVFDFPAAIESARQVNVGGDYLTLFAVSMRRPISDIRTESAGQTIRASRISKSCRKIS